jgi:formylglycine-generating enzyme required for sulfatase activity
VPLLETADAGIALEDRIAAARLLGGLDDPRFPVEAEQWGAELGKRNERFGQPTGYFCFVPKGVYKIGGWETDEPAADVSLSPFWIARFPITVAQFAPFVEQGYGAEAERWWTQEGWKWRQAAKRDQPSRWRHLPLSGPNQPVTGVTWYEATAFCAWLTERLANTVPQGYVLRLPTEAEWEAAAAYDAQMQRRTYPWGKAEPTPELAIYDASGLQQPAPVGCCPAGAAACGALDLAGNVWEVTSSSYQAYPAQGGTPANDFTPDTLDVPWRGGSFYYDDSTSVRCGARDGKHPVSGLFINGFRVVLAPFHSR